MKAVLAVFERAAEARKALDALEQAGAPRDQISLLEYGKDTTGFERVVSEYRLRVNSADKSPERTLLAFNVITTTDAGRARDLLLMHGARTVSERVEPWPNSRPLHFG